MTFMVESFRSQLKQIIALFEGRWTLSIAQMGWLISGLEDALDYIEQGEKEHNTLKALFWGAVHELERANSNRGTRLEVAHALRAALHSEEEKP